MIASPNPFDPADNVNVVQLRDGRRIHLNDILTAAEGQTILDDLDASMTSIEDQTDAADIGLRRNDPHWRVRADRARRIKGRIRPRLQQRIAELRRAEKTAALPPPPPASTTNVKRQAFVLAAEELLDREVITEIWARAQELRPAAFAGGGGSAP